MIKSRHRRVVVTRFGPESPHTNNCLLPTDERRLADDLGRVHAMGVGDIEET